MSQGLLQPAASELAAQPQLPHQHHFMQLGRRHGNTFSFGIFLLPFPMRLYAVTAEHLLKNEEKFPLNTTQESIKRPYQTP